MPTNRLPIPNQDSGNWGTILNSYLNTTLSDTGGINTCDVVYLDDNQVIITNAVITSITNSFITTPAAPATTTPPIKLEITEIPGKPIDYILNKKTKSLFKLTKSGPDFTLTKVNNIPHIFSVVNINTNNIFRWIEDTTTPANSTWKIISSGDVVNVKDWGARGDNLTDDTEAIQRAIDTVALNYSDSAIIFIPKGRFVISSEIQIKTYVKLCGDGQSTAIIANNTNGIDCTSNAVQIEDLSLFTNAPIKDGGAGDATITQYTGIYIQESGFSNIRRVGIIGNWAKGIHCRGAIKCRFENLVIESNQSVVNQGSVGIYSEYSVNNILRDCRMGGYDKCIYFRAVLDKTNVYSNEGWIISHCIFVISNYSIYVEKGINNGGDQPGVLHLDVSNNVFDFNRFSAIRIEFASNVKIHSNWLAGWDDPSWVGLQIGSIYIATITNNSIVKNLDIPGQKAVSVGYGSSLVMANNNFRAPFGGEINGESISLYGNVFDSQGTPITSNVASTTFVNQVVITNDNTSNMPPLKVLNLPEYTDNTSAKAGGLTAGAFYRTSTGDLKVVF